MTSTHSVNRFLFVYVFIFE